MAKKLNTKIRETNDLVTRLVGFKIIFALSTSISKKVVWPQGQMSHGFAVEGCGKVLGLSSEEFQVDVRDSPPSPLDFCLSWMSSYFPEEHEDKSPSYRLTSAHPSTKLRAGSFDQAQGRLLRKPRKVRQPQCGGDGRKNQRCASSPRSGMLRLNTEVVPLAAS